MYEHCHSKWQETVLKSSSFPTEININLAKTPKINFLASLEFNFKKKNKLRATREKLSKRQLNFRKVAL